MPKQTITAILALEGGAQFRAELKATCAEIKLLGAHIETVSKSVTQLNESLRELAELRKTAI